MKMELELTEINKNNFRLIKENSLKVGNILTLKEDYGGFKEGTDFVISYIHSSGGWILFKETEQLPQEAEKILKILKRDTKKNIINTFEIENGNRK